MTSSVPTKMPNGRFFSGLRISPALKVETSQPLNAHSTATRAIPNGPSIPPAGASGAFVAKCEALPLAKAKTAPIRTISAANLMTVKRFWTSAPHLTPRMLTAIRMKMRPMATAFVAAGERRTK